MGGADGCHAVMMDNKSCGVQHEPFPVGCTSQFLENGHNKQSNQLDEGWRFIFRSPHSAWAQA
jgi:hypothetical protein